jgi:hypothetical protein
MSSGRYRNQVGLKLNGTHQLLSYADDVNLLEDNINTVNKDTESLIDASKEVGPEVNVQKTKYALVSCHENADQNLNRSFENVSQFKDLGTTVTHQILIQKEIKKRLNSGSVCYYSSQNLLSSYLLPKNVKI